jgi:class 3 adenylate cyclase
LFACFRCTTNPTDAQLKAWRKDASDRNAQIMAANANKEKPSQWNLQIQGETVTGKPVELNWQQLQVLATEQVKTPDPINIMQPNQVFDFRGVSVATLIKQFGVASDVNEVTFVCFDSYHTTILLQDLQANPIILAIAPSGIENIHVGVAVKRNMTILFCDIRGYTSMSEVMTPLETFAFLNDYLACMAKAIDEADGFIDKYIGDAIMALFDDEATDGALKAAILMQQALLKFNYERSQNNLPKIAVEIGIHRGEVVMGTVGYACRIDSTVVGDAVNIASRIEGLTKQYNCGILVTESVVNSLQYPELFALRLIDNAVKVKGKDEAIALYERTDLIDK